MANFSCRNGTQQHAATQNRQALSKQNKADRSRRACKAMAHKMSTAKTHWMSTDFLIFTPDRTFTSNRDILHTPSATIEKLMTT